MINALIVDDDMATVEVVRNAVHWKQLGVENVSKAYNIEQAKKILLNEPINLVISEALAASWYGLELFTAGAETHDAKAPDGRLVQIKATQIDRVALSSEPEWLLVMKIHHDGIFIEEYNGPGALAWEHCGKMQKNGQRPISLAALKQS